MWIAIFTYGEKWTHIICVTYDLPLWVRNCTRRDTTYSGVSAKLCAEIINPNQRFTIRKKLANIHWNLGSSMYSWTKQTLNHPRQYLKCDLISDFTRLCSETWLSRSSNLHYEERPQWTWTILNRNLVVHHVLQLCCCRFCARPLSSPVLLTM